MIVVVRDGGDFLLNKKPKISCSEKHGTEIELIDPQKQVISINWTFHSPNDYQYVSEVTKPLLLTRFSFVSVRADET